MTILRTFRVPLFTGFIWRCCWSRCFRQPLILALLGLPASQSILLVMRHGNLTWVQVFNFTHRLFACPALPWTRSVEGLSSPLYGLMASRYRRGSAFTWHLQGRDFHPHGHSVVKVLFQSIRGTGTLRLILRTLTGSSF